MAPATALRRTETAAVDDAKSGGSRIGLDQQRVVVVSGRNSALIKL
jgi:hypothetical protein